MSIKKETPTEMRVRASRMKECAQHSNGQGYHEQMQAADHLFKRAAELEVKQAKAVKKPKPKPTAKEVQRKKDLAKIHAMKKQLGFDDDTYRDMLEQVTSLRSAGKLNGVQRGKLIKHLYSLGAGKAKKSYPGRPHNTDSNAQMGKIEACLAEAKLPWSYAAKIAKNQCGKEKLEFCNSTELSGVINALLTDAKRHGRRVK